MSKAATSPEFRDSTNDAPSVAGQGIPGSQELLRVTLSSIGEGVITTDASGRVTFLNPVAQDLTGWSHHEAVNLPLESVFRTVHEKSRKPAESPVTRALRERVVIGPANHTILIARDGSERFIDHSAAPVRGLKDNITSVVLVFRDVSELKRQQNLTTDALAYAQGVLDTQRHGFVVLDGHLRVKSANASFYRTFQITEKDALNEHFHRLGGGDWNIPRLSALLKDVLVRDQAFEDFEIEQDFPDVGCRNLLLTTRRLALAGPEKLILLGIEDVTDRRAAERTLRISEIRYRRLFQFAKDGILILDARTGKIIDANAFMCGLLGQELTELTGKELYEIGLFKDVEANKAMFEKLRSEGYVRYDHLPIQTPTGKTTSVEFVSNVYSEDNRLVAQCNVRDITERTRLEDRVKLQTLAMEDQSRRKDDFLAMLSHELRNPLAPILSATHLLKSQEGASENTVQKQAREVVERQVAHLTRIVSDLLEVSRVVSGHIQVRVETVDFSRIVRHTCESIRPLAEHRKQQMQVTLPADPVWVTADATRLEQIVMNLLENAIKYTDEGGRIWLDVERGDGQAALHVRDSGVGIAAEILPCVFELFMQADRSLNRVQGGLGLGLNLVQRLVKLQGGTVEALSEGLGKGSEFIVRLPLAAGPPGDQATAVTSGDGPRKTPLRVLVVDDNVDACNMLTMLLEQSGRTVGKAYAGPEALDLALTWKPDVVLLDIGLPGMNGYEVARRLRLDPSMKNTRLVALTGYGSIEDVVLAREAGFDAHLLKPVSLREVEEFLTAPKK